MGKKKKTSLEMLRGSGDLGGGKTSKANLFTQGFLLRNNGIRNKCRIGQVLLEKGGGKGDRHGR